MKKFDYQSDCKKFKNGDNVKISFKDGKNTVIKKVKIISIDNKKISFEDKENVYECILSEIISIKKSIFKKILLVFVCSLMLLCLIRIKIYEEKIYICGEDVICDEQLVRTKNTNQPISGTVKQYDKNGKLILQETVKEGKLDGWRTIYLEDMKIEVNYVKGERKYHKTYHPNGNLKKEIRYNRDMIDGVAKTYYEDGNLETEFFYSSGEVKKKLLYYNNGQLAEESHWKDGQLDGIKRIYDENGIFISEILFTKGNIDILKTYYKNGQLKNEAIYLPSEITEKVYNEQGELISSETMYTD